MGDVDIQTVQCDQANNVCQIRVPAPAVALVYLTGQALEESGMTATQTFATTYTAVSAVSIHTHLTLFSYNINGSIQPLTGPANTATVDQAVLATSNGRGGAEHGDIGSTSFGSTNGADSLRQTVLVSSVVHVTMAMVGAAVVLWIKM